MRWCGGAHEEIVGPGSPQIFDVLGGDHALH